MRKVEVWVNGKLVTKGYLHKFVATDVIMAIVEAEDGWCMTVFPSSLKFIDNPDEVKVNE